MFIKLTIVDPDTGVEIPTILDINEISKFEKRDNKNYVVYKNFDPEDGLSYNNEIKNDLTDIDKKLVSAGLLKY